MVKVLIADDHPVVRQGLKQILGETPDLVVAGEALNGQEALEQVQTEEWDVLILDVSMPVRNGLEVLKELKRQKSKLPVLMLSMYSEDQFAMRLLKAGASGYLTKESMPEEVVQAIRKVVNGGKYVGSFLAEKLAFKVEAESNQLLHETLSDREFQVMRMLASGKSVKHIAEELALSVKTISTYRARILQKMNLRNNAELIHYAIQNQLVD